MIDLYLDPDTNDLVYADGIFQAVSDYKELLRQRLYMQLNTFMGEWFINTDFGMPYRESILIKNITQAEVDAIFITKINEEDLVDEIVSYEGSLDKSTRKYSASFTVKVTNETIENPLVVTTTDEWDYTATDSSLASASCYTTEANSIYYHINFELPVDGIYTWINSWS